MKRFIFALLLFALASQTHGQQSEAQAFIRYQFRNLNRIVFPTFLATHAFSSIKDALQASTLRSERESLRSRYDPDSILVLSDQEREYLLQELEKQQNRTDSSLVNVFEAGTVTTDNSGQLGYFNRNRDWSDFKQAQANSFYSFSRPLFIRNNTLCFFYYYFTCGHNCSHGKFAVYRKTRDNAWLPWLVLFTSVS
ncbi:hypothetical protein ACO2Q8_25965 [Larkinella sp. VNQ87]|uniref:hypothetical protein n=1 Tax=Larkinella sp. VNQ87 TaxID=3400921 RepID=UPI003C1216B1